MSLSRRLIGKPDASVASPPAALLRHIPAHILAVADIPVGGKGEVWPRFKFPSGPGTLRSPRGRFNPVSHFYMNNAG
jgi:hypothetical protein